jgi:uncharacterized membrane protein
MGNNACARDKRQQALGAARMNRERMIRFAAVLVGAAVLLVLEQQLGVKFYVAIPGGIVAYVITLVALGFMFGGSEQPK